MAVIFFVRSSNSNTNGILQQVEGSMEDWRESAETRQENPKRDAGYCKNRSCENLKNSAYTTSQQSGRPYVLDPVLAVYSLRLTPIHEVVPHMGKN